MKNSFLVSLALFLTLPTMTQATAIEESQTQNYTNILLDKNWPLEFTDQIDPTSAAGTVYLQQGEEKNIVNIDVQNKVMQATPITTLPKTKFVMTTNNDIATHAVETSTETYNTEYGFKWQRPSNDYHDFYLIGQAANGQTVAGYETRNGKVAFGITVGAHKSTVTSKYGSPLKMIEKNGSSYTQNYKNGYGDTTHSTYLIDGKYVTFFYDVHASNRVRSITWVDQATEAKKPSFFGEPSQALQKSFEELMVELINESRVAAGLQPLIYTPNHNPIARLHSQDMIDHDYFSHQNLKGESARERMINGGMSFTWYGENLAYGQYSAIYAHEALMNSLGHRENILRERFTHVFVGVEFKNNGAPYFTINFYEE